MPDSTFELNLIQTGQDILDRIGFIASSKYIKDGDGFPTPFNLTSRTGKTRNALLGGVGSIRKIVPEVNKLTLTYGVELNVLPGMRLLELGGVVSPGQRKLFWRRYKESVPGTMLNEMWFNMAKGKKIFKPRHTIENSITDSIPEVRKILKDGMYRVIQTSIRRIISDTNSRNT